MPERPTLQPSPAPAPRPAAAMAATTGTAVRDIEAGVQAGNLTPQAGRDLFSHLQSLLFNPGGQHDQQQYQQLVQTFDQDTTRADHRHHDHRDSAQRPD